MPQKRSESPVLGSKLPDSEAIKKPYDNDQFNSNLKSDSKNLNNGKEKIQNEENLQKISSEMGITFSTVSSNFDKKMEK